LWLIATNLTKEKKKMLNIKIVRPEQLPAEPGIVFHINDQNEVTAITASTNVKQRCDVRKMARARAQAEAKNAEYFSSQIEWKTENLLKSPESFERLVYWAMPFEQADALAKKMRKSGNTRMMTRFYDFAS